MKNVQEIIAESRANNNVLSDDLIATLDETEEYIKDNDIYCKKCDTRRTCFGFTRKVRCICKCQKEAKDQEEEEVRKKERLKRIEKLREASLLGDRYKTVSFETTDLYNADYELVFNRCKKYCEVADQVLNRGIGIYLFGSKGVGKSHLTACMANKLMENYYTVLFTNFSEISKSIRSSFGKKGKTELEFMDKLGSIDFLFIDDFGTELLTKNEQDLWLQEKVFDIVNKRYNNNKPIIFTSNYTLSQMINSRGLADKTADRIMEMCETMKLEGDSYRKKVKKQSEPIF